jgi:hypothetical protein
MKIFIGRVEADEVDEFGEEGLVGPDSMGNYYGQSVEFGTNPGGMDEVTIADGCNRSIPVNVEALPDLIAALQEVLNTLEEINHAEMLKQKVESDTNAYVEDESVCWDESFQDFDWNFED